DNATVAQTTGEATQQRVRIDAGVAVEPAVFVIEQRLQVQRRYLLRRGRVAPHAVAVGKRTQRRTVAREHHGTAGVGGGEMEREQAVENECREQQESDCDEDDAQPAPRTGAARDGGQRGGCDRGHDAGGLPCSLPCCTGEGWGGVALRYAGAKVKSFTPSQPPPASRGRSRSG